MNKLLLHKLIQHNKVWLPITLTSLLFLTQRNTIFNTFLYIFLLYIANYKTVTFSPFRYNIAQESNNRYTALNLLPIDKQKYKLYSYINATIWASILSIFLIIAGQTITSSYANIGFVIFAFALSFSLLLFNIIDNTITDLSGGAYYLLALTSWLIWFILVMQPIGLINISISSSHYLLIILVVTIIPLVIEGIDKVFHKLGSNIQNTSPIFSNINLSFIKIHNLSRYSLVDSKSIVIQGPSIMWLIYIAQNTKQFTFIILFLNILAIISNTYNYYNKQTLMRLAPISLNQKKMACNITSIFTITLLTLTITPILGIIQHLSFTAIIHDIILYGLLSLLIYALTVIFIHLQYNLVSLLYLTTAGIVSAVLLFNFLTISNPLTFLLPLIAIIALLVVDYYKLDVKQ